MRQYRSCLFALAAVMMILTWGCGGSGGPGGGAALLPVKGKVTYKGKPLTSGIVKFEIDGYGRPATGKLQSDGSFALGTMKEGDGAIPGEHQVTVAGFDKSLAKDRALKKYANARTSGLTAEVDADHTEFTFDLR